MQTLVAAMQALAPGAAGAVAPEDLRDWAGLLEVLLVKVAGKLVAQTEAGWAAQLKERGGYWTEERIQKEMAKREREGNCLFMFAMVCKEWLTGSAAPDGLEPAPQTGEERRRSGGAHQTVAGGGRLGMFAAASARSVKCGGVVGGLCSWSLVQHLLRGCTCPWPADLHVKLSREGRPSPSRCSSSSPSCLVVAGARCSTRTPPAPAARRAGVRRAAGRSWSGGAARCTAARARWPRCSPPRAG